MPVSPSFPTVYAAAGPRLPGVRESLSPAGRGWRVAGWRGPARGHSYAVPDRKNSLKKGYCYLPTLHVAVRILSAIVRDRIPFAQKRA